MKIGIYFILFSFFFCVYTLRAADMPVIYSADSLSGEARVLRSQFVTGQECVWTLKLPANASVKVTKINSVNLSSSSQVHLYVNAVQLILSQTAVGEYSTTITGGGELNLVLEAGHSTNLFEGSDPIITVKFAKISNEGGSETTVFGGDVELSDGMLRASGYREFMGSKVAAVLGNRYDSYTCFGAVNGGRIRGSNEGYLVLDGNPNGYGSPHIYMNRYSIGGNIIMTHSSGKVGIGVDSPQEKLHLGGAIRGDGTNGALRISTKYGQLELGAQNENGVQFNTALPKFIFNREMDVKGYIRATEVKIEDISNFPDYVFRQDYKLRPLSEVNRFIRTNGHLPEIPSAAEVESEGMNMAEMQLKLLQKVEELTLYVIEQQNEIQNLKAELNQLKR